MVKNKGQMKIQQMAIMLLAVTIFFAMIGLLIIGIKVADLRQSSDTIKEQNTLTLAMKIANSPELSCGGAFGDVKLNCIDLDKAIVLKENINKYSINTRDSFWGRDVNIEISRIYPDYGNKECNIVTYPNCGVVKMFEDRGGFSNYNYVLLCRKTQIDGTTADKCELGQIRISYEQWNQE